MKYFNDKKSKYTRFITNIERKEEKKTVKDFISDIYRKKKIFSLVEFLE